MATENKPIILWDISKDELTIFLEFNEEDFFNVFLLNNHRIKKEQVNLSKYFKTKLKVENYTYGGNDGVKDYFEFTVLNTLFKFTCTKPTNEDGKYLQISIFNFENFKQWIEYKIDFSETYIDYVVWYNIYILFFNYNLYEVLLSQTSWNLLLDANQKIDWYISRFKEMNTDNKIKIKKKIDEYHKYIQKLHESEKNKEQNINRFQLNYANKKSKEETRPFLKEKSSQNLLLHLMKDLYNYPRVCVSCGGTGFCNGINSFGEQVRNFCPDCNGKGYVGDSTVTLKARCISCGGMGFREHTNIYGEVGRTPCIDCRGTGYMITGWGME